MTTAITGPTVAPGALQFDPISSAAMFPRVARLARKAQMSVPDAPFGTLLRRVELPASAVRRPARCGAEHSRQHVRDGHRLAGDGGDRFRFAPCDALE
jgi:hypothetical protein